MSIVQEFADQTIPRTALSSDLDAPVFSGARAGFICRNGSDPAKKTRDWSTRIPALRSTFVTWKVRESVDDITRAVRTVMISWGPTIITGDGYKRALVLIHLWFAHCSNKDEADCAPRNVGETQAIGSLSFKTASLLSPHATPQQMEPLMWTKGLTAVAKRLKS